MTCSSAVPTPTRGALARETPEGFTLIELLMVMVIIGTLARIAIPNFHVMRTKAEAADVIGNFDVVRVAALTYNADNHGWPEDAGAGEIPDGLENYLPEGFTFVDDEYTLEYEHWVLPDGLPQHPNATVLVGVSLVTSNTELGNEVMELLGGGSAIYAVGDHYTLIFEGR